MTDSLAVAVQNVSKMYRLFDSPQQRLLEALHPLRRKYHREFWALRDISFEVPQGATLGIIGRNGSGKSTLLQIICSVLSPTLGTVEVHGKTAAILELGIGFHPEFTGRENVLMTSYLQGYAKKEMLGRLALVEEFADIGEFIDQPVKTYSSGMVMRLAFAAAINVEPDVLVIDEALAVGDAKFQYKCYKKIMELRREGKTIILVTHDINAILRHCSQAMWLNDGRIVQMGDPREVADRYHRFIVTGIIDSDLYEPSMNEAANYRDNLSLLAATNARSPLEEFLEDTPDEDRCPKRNNYNPNEYRFGERQAEIIDYLIICGDQYDPAVIRSGERIDIYLKVLSHQPCLSPTYGFSLHTKDGLMVYGDNTWLKKVQLKPTKQGEMTVYRLSLEMKLAGGDYFISQGITEKTADDYRPLDIRNGLIHLFVQQNIPFSGIVNIESKVEEISVN
ncbi:MAG: ABC transporter ATP-binding protein [Thermodesulfobacteriota bacterium]